jgi:hypothetical protein
VQVRWRDGRTYPTNTTNVTVEGGYYNLPEAPGQARTRVETALEGAAASAMVEIDRTGRLPEAGSQERFDVAVLVAAQVVRGRGASARPGPGGRSGRARDGLALGPSSA